MSWDDVQEFLERLKDSRLPTEAEWEYACRAGTKGATYGGPTLDDIAWYDANSDEKTQIVKQKRPNAWGLYDTLGNVWELCADGRRNYRASAERDPIGSTGPKRVVRGGGYWYGARGVRAAFRFASGPGYRDDGIGFRLARGQRRRQAGKAGGRQPPTIKSRAAREGKRGTSPDRASAAVSRSRVDSKRFEKL